MKAKRTPNWLFKRISFGYAIGSWILLAALVVPEWAWTPPEMKVLVVVSASLILVAVAIKQS